MMVKYSKKEAVDATRAIAGNSDRLIATYGLRMALVIAKGTMERVQASYNSMEKKYGNPKGWS